MVRSILPKLAWALSDALVINPAQQAFSLNLGPFSCLQYSALV